MARARRTIIGKVANDELFTPEFLIDWLPPIDLDPCWSYFSHVRPRVAYYDITTDGLHSPWGLPGVRFVFVNPPYSDMVGWLTKCAYEAASNPGMVVCALVPAKPGENAWHTQVWPYATGAKYVGFLRGRLKHTTMPGILSVSGTFGSSLLSFGALEDVLPIVADVALRARGHKHEPVWVRREDPCHRVVAPS